ncbi:hypothetical protein [Sphingomonas aquatilis]
MRYDPRIATVSRAEFEELLAIVRLADAPPRPKTEDDRWRADYAEAQRRRRIVGYQQDLFSSTTMTHYRRNAAAPEWARAPVETVEQKLERIKGDRFATFGPPRSDRPSILTAQERAEIVRKAGNWLSVRRRVRLVDAPGSVDPAFGIQRYLGREGVVWRLCGAPFDDHCYVFFDAVGAERTAKIEFAELRDLEPVG